MMIKTTSRPLAEFKGDTLVCLVRQDEKMTGREPALAAVAEIVRRAAELGDFTGKKEQILLHYSPPASGLPARLLLVGLGKEEPGREELRQAGGIAISRLLKGKAKKVLVLLPETAALAPAEAAAALSEGLLLGGYRFRKYKGKAGAAAVAAGNGAGDEENGDAPLPSLTIAGPAGIGAAVKQAAGVAEAVLLARDLANEPGNQWTPTHFADYARQLAKKYPLKARVLDKDALQKQGFGGILAVSQGSAQPPCLVVLEYRQAGSKAPTLLLVGKGLTFDSGGISLKPGQGMEEMKYDMCGGAAVLAAMQVIGQERPKGVNVVALVPATENLPGPAALKPGDIIRQYGGKSVEVINTDAEGRLIVADALAYGIEKFKPTAVVDLATLTGAVIIALGHHRTGLLGNDDELCAKVLAAGEQAGEPLWRLPLAPEYSKQLKSKVADLKNVDKRDAGAILGAAFLQEFVGNTPWAHLDIAGTAWNFTEKSYVPKGPSGIGVRTLVELVRAWR